MLGDRGAFVLEEFVGGFANRDGVGSECGSLLSHEQATPVCDHVRRGSLSDFFSSNLLYSLLMIIGRPVELFPPER